MERELLIDVSRGQAPPTFTPVLERPEGLETFIKQVKAPCGWEPSWGLVIRGFFKASCHVTSP